MQAQPYLDDKTLLGNIEAALRKHAELNNVEVCVKTRSGEVFLTGSVESRDQKRRILTTVRGVHGVKSIKEDLSLLGTASR